MNKTKMKNKALNVDLKFDPFIDYLFEEVGMHEQQF